MDLQTLSNLFATTLTPNRNVQIEGELALRKIASQEGMIAACLQIIASDSVELPIRQACAIWLKNRVYNSYGLESPTGRPDREPMPPSDRAALKTHILPLLANSPSKSITVQLAATLKTLVSHDFPEKWPELMDGVKHMLASSNIREVGAGCVVALEVAKAFRFSQQTEVLPKFTAELFPTLVNIALQLLSSPPAGVENDIPAILHYILKTYRSSIIVNLSPHLQSAESLVPWGRLLFQVVELDIPAGAVPEDPEEREKSEWWKAKKWAYAVLGRLFHRFGNPSQLPSTMKEEYTAFAEHFVSAFAPEILKVYLNQTERFVSGQAWLSKKCQYLIFQFFTDCVKPKSTWALLKPHFERLVETFVYPNLSFTQSKQELWDTDPVDYVRTTVDEYETYNSPVAAATTFLLQIANTRTKTTFMPILSLINHVLNSNPAPPQRFGALNMTAALGPLIMRHSDVRGNMPQFMRQHVYPCFTAPEKYLRAIACEVLGTVESATIKWDDEENMNNHFRAVAACLDDPELPVRVQAALALTEMITSHESVRNGVAPQVGKVIQDLLKMCDETDLDILNSSMETMVEQFHAELLPVAVQLAARLCDSYLRLIKEALVQEENAPKGIDLESAMEEGDQDKTYAAMGMAKTITTLVAAVDSSPEILQQVQQVIIPIISFTLENKMIDLFDNIYDLVDGLTFRTKAIAPNMWPVFEMTYKLFKSDAVDFLDEMLPALDNFVSYGTEMFKSRPDYRQMVADIYTTSIVSDQLGENDRVNGSKIAEALLLNLRGHIDDLLPPIIKTALDHIDSAETPSFRLANLEVLINAVLYNPAATLHIMEQYAPGTSRKFFDKWFNFINTDKLPRVHDKRLTIVALCALMEVDPSSIPEAVRDGWPGIVGGALKVFKDLPKAIAARKALEQEIQEEDFEDFEDDDEAISRALAENDDDEDIWDEDSAYIEMLAKENARLKSRSLGVPVEDDEEAEEEEEIEEELGYLSPLDSVNPYVTFKHSLTALQNKSAQMYQIATTSLDVEQQTLLMEVMRLAETQNGSA